MKNLITYLKTLWSWLADSQSTDVSLDCRLTVARPSFDRRSTMLKLVSVLVLILTLGSGNAWGTTSTLTLKSSTSRTSGWTDNDVTWTFSSVTFVNDNNACVGKTSGYVTITPPSGATTTQISVTKTGNAWAGAAQLKLYVGSSSTAHTTLNSSSSTTTNISITGSDQSASSFTLSNVTSKNCWVASITITFTTASCTVNPSATGNASINSSFTLTSLTDAVSVSSGTWGPGASCAWTDYGFVWGTTSSPTTSDNKVQVGTSGTATSWSTDASHKVQPSGSTTPTSWSVGTTYYVKAYGKNGKAGAEFFYSGTAASFTLRSITYNSNGGSTVNTQYVNSGGTYSAPTAPTKTGYTFGGWYTDNGTFANAMDWSSAISANKALYAKWTAKNYTVTLNDNGGSGGSGSKSVTYNANTNMTTNVAIPTKTGYDFGGYWTSTNSGATLTTQVINADGSWKTSVGDYTDGTPNWIHDGDVTLYAKWTIQNYTITWKVDGVEWSDKGGTENANYNTAWSSLTLPTDPGSTELTGCGANKFVGWTTTEGYESADTPPASLLNSGNKSSKTSTYITGNTVFHAVFADYGE